MILIISRDLLGREDAKIYANAPLFGFTHDMLCDRRCHISFAGCLLIVYTGKVKVACHEKKMGSGLVHTCIVTDMK